MPGKFKAMLCDYGPYKTQCLDRDGNVYVHEDTISRKRVKDWVSRFKKMKAKGVNVPVPWGHRLDAIPSHQKIYLSSLDKSNEGEFAKNNATYVEDLMADDRGLWMIADCPPGYKVKDGKLVNESAGTQVAEFSVGIGDWMDRDGERYSDAILHAAIVPFPVIHDQPPIVALSANSPSPVAKFTQMFSRSGSAMKKPSDSMPPDEEEVVEDGDEEVVEDDLDTNPPEEPPVEMLSESEEVEDPVEPPEVPGTQMDSVAPMPSSGPNKDFMQAMDMLRQIGLDVPNDVDERDGWRFLATALRVAVSMGAKFQKPNDDMQAQETVKMSSEQPGSGQVTAETPPVLLSANKIKDPVARQLALREEARLRQDLKSTWEKAKTLGCPVHIADREGAKGGMVCLSLTKAGTPVLPVETASASLVLEVLSAMKGVPVANLFATLSAQVQQAPEYGVDSKAIAGEDEQARKAFEQKIDEALKRGASSV